MATPFVPCLKSTKDKLSNPVEIMQYVFDAYVRTPSGINDTFAENEISLTYDLAENTTQEGLQRTAKDNLTGVLTKYFPSGIITIEVSHGEMADNGIRQLTFDIEVTVDGVTHRLGDELTVVDGKIQL